MKLKYLSLSRTAAYALLGVLLLAAGATQSAARTRKGDKLLLSGRAAEAKGEWDTALDLYEQAVEQDPADTAYLLAMRHARFEAGQKHVDNAQKLRTQGKLPEAVQEYQKALIADPSSAIALQEVKRVMDMIRNGPRSGVTPDDQALTPAERARKESNDRVEAMLSPPVLKPMTVVMPTLKMNNQPPRVLFETVGKLVGVNVVFDPQYNAPGRNFNVDLTNATADQAFDYLALLTHTFWKPIASNAIFVTEDNVTKRRDYEDDVVKVFYVTNATSVQEFQEIATAIRTVAEIRRVFTYNAQRAMIVRDTVDKVALAEKLVHDLDKPKSEVVVDVIVMEANSERVRDLAATIANASGIPGLNVSATFSPGGAAASGATAATSIALSRLGHLSSNQWQATLPGALLQATMSDNRTKVLNNPQVRASDGQKVTLKIGNRIPYATGSFQTNTAAALVSTQFNYADVGVNVDMTPQIHSNDEVTLHVEVTVSSVQQYVSIGGISQPVIGQRSNTADIRLKDGEINIMGGLSQTQDVHNIAGLPWLVNIPVLGKLFGSDHVDKSRGDLLIALIPHVVRTPDYTAENLRGIYAGTDQTVKLNYAPRVSGDGAPSSYAAPAASAAPVPATPPQTAASQPALALGSPVSLVPGLNQAARLNFTPATMQVAAGAPVTVTLQLENANNVASAAPVKIQFSASQLRLDDVLLSEMFMSEGITAALVKDIRNDSGEAVISVTRPPGAAPVSGSGGVAILKFTAIGKGQGTVRVSDMSIKDTQGQNVPATPGAFSVTVQ